MADALVEGFNDAYTHITESESAYSAATRRLQTALDSVPDRFSPILSSLSRYQQESAGLGDSELKTAANELLQELNVSYATGYDIITASLPVSFVLDNHMTWSCDVM